jgi:hypothetical protein
MCGGIFLGDRQSGRADIDRNDTTVRSVLGNRHGNGPAAGANVGDQEILDFGFWILDCCLP